MDPKYIDENDFFELYHNQIESGKLEGEAFAYAIDLIREKAESDTVAYFRRLEKIYYYLLQYKYFPEKQGAYWVMQIRKHTSELQFLNRVSTPALRKKVEAYFACKTLYLFRNPDRSLNIPRGYTGRMDAGYSGG